MVIPREHGAWGMLLVPLATGAVAALRSGVNGGALALFILASMSLFWLRTPVESWLGTSAIKAQTKDERAFVLKVIAAIGMLAVVSIAALLWNGQLSRPADDWRDRRLSFRDPSWRQETGAQRKDACADHRCGGPYLYGSRRVLRRHGQTRPHRGRAVAGQLAVRRQTRFTSCRYASAPAAPPTWTRR